jgi:hypothetical protein
MLRKISFAGLFLGIIVFTIFFTESCTSNGTEASDATKSSGTTDTTGAPVMVSISQCTVNSVLAGSKTDQSAGNCTLGNADSVACTITSDINMTSATIYLRERVTPATNWGQASSTPNAKTINIPVSVSGAPSNTCIYPKVMICSGTKCNTYEYNSGLAAPPYKYSQVGVGFTTIDIFLY